MSSSKAIKQFCLPMDNINDKTPLVLPTAVAMNLLGTCGVYTAEQI